MAKNELKGHFEMASRKAYGLSIIPMEKSYEKYISRKTSWKAHLRSGSRMERDLKDLLRGVKLME